VSTDLVGPLRTKVMHDGQRLVVEVPRNTLDPRYLFCTEHRVGCDCYEAERNEDRDEYRSMWNEASDAAREVLAGHRTYPASYSYDWDAAGRPVYEFDEGSCCMCTGCQIARKAHLR
jgi:hypothetical protein